jgi:hypothetical protein
MPQSIESQPEMPTRTAGPAALNPDCLTPTPILGDALRRSPHLENSALVEAMGSHFDIAAAATAPRGGRREC